MKNFIFLLYVLTFFSCKEVVRNEKTTKKLAINDEKLIDFHEPIVTNNLMMLSKEDLLGYWVGEFKADLSDYEIDTLVAEDENVYYNLHKKITLSIDEIEDSIVKGHSIVSGNIRPFNGKITFQSNQFNLELQEPGDDQYDGKFLVSIKSNDSLMIGTWKANEVLKIDRRKLELKKRLFVYNPENELEDVYTDWDKSKKVEHKETIDDQEETWFEDEYLTSTNKVFEKNPSVDILTKEFVENLKKSDIFILRNSIYARHGYSFKNRQLRSYFEMHEWYMPVFNDVSKDFTEIELKNIDLLLLYEENAEEYYDRFGR
ncbi:conserved hypothetical protein [Flavobacterium sp. 9AF]|uniref:YARHG domain-containing protein n=1 Tax=Flavobacterium sp. 9AF TaxID=2653142 RepID=UPI0012F46CDE|nr:YARHG domain-containing protein [Flavobacterium sp. 9AF]VXC24324.1 conserved hypothetical protein [Flavobacterium sp. 9AF]